MRTDRRSGARTELGRAVLAAGALLAVAGCATGGGAAASSAQRATAAPTADAAPRYKGDGAPNDKDPYKIVIAFDAKGCPASATTDFVNCPGDKTDCLRMKGGQTVRFESTKAFTLQFDPFAEGKFASSATQGETPEKQVVVKKAAMHGHDKGKPYTYVVTADGCDTPLDPQIILD